MSNASIQNTGCFAGTKMDWFHLSIIIDTKILLLHFKKAKDDYFMDRFDDAIDNPRNACQFLNNLANNSHSKKKKDIDIQLI